MIRFRFPTSLRASALTPAPASARSLARRVFLLTGLSVASAWFLAGCSADFKLSGILVNIVALKQVNVTGKEAQITLALQYTNENVVPLAATTTHKLYLNGTFVGRSVNPPPLGLPQLGTVTQDTTFQLENLSLFNQLKAMAEKQTASYKLETRIKVQSGEDENELKTVGQGSLDLRPILGKS